MNAIEDVKSERNRQVQKEGWTFDHDDSHTDNSLVMAAISYAAPVAIKAKGHVPCGCRSVECEHWEGRVEAWLDPWPWEASLKRKDRRYDLVRAAALIVAEIERIDRRTAREEECTQYTKKENGR